VTASEDLPWSAGAPLAELGGDARALDARTHDYRRFLASSTRGDDSYLFTDPRVRFCAEDADVLMAAPGLEVRAERDGASIGSSALRQRISCVGLPARKLEATLASLDGERTLAEICREVGLTQDERASLLGAGFGLVLFTPLAGLELEQRIPSAEIVRFPGSPYEVTRAYWRNMASVRERAHAFEQQLGSTQDALAELRKLHAVSLLGDKNPCFYRPASPIADKGIGPGELFRARTVVERDGERIRFVSGPRVNATFLGGSEYTRLLCERLLDPDAEAEQRVHIGDDGLEWGRVLYGSAAQDQHAAAWFCPPRPLDEAHFESLFQSLARALEAAERSSREERLSALAAFHQKFVRLHPFRASNQGVAMNLVNRVLASAGGTGIPHLLLDHLALRLSERAYALAFRRAVGAWSALGTGKARFLALSEHKRSFFELVHALSNEAARDGSEKLLASSPEAARLALLVD
jgi:hypothetical protein